MTCPHVFRSINKILLTNLLVTVVEEIQKVLYPVKHVCFAHSLPNKRFGTHVRADIIEKLNILLNKIGTWYSQARLGKSVFIISVSQFAPVLLSSFVLE